MKNNKTLKIIIITLLFLIILAIVGVIYFNKMNDINDEKNMIYEIDFFDGAEPGTNRDIKIYKELIALKQLEYSIEKKYVKAKDGSVEKQYYENQLTTLRQVITSQNIIKTNDEYELKLAKMKEDHERELGAIKAQQTDADNKEEIKSVENLIDLYKKLGKTIARML